MKNGASIRKATYTYEKMTMEDPSFHVVRIVNVPIWVEKLGKVVSSK
jgi:hypothetical protein